MKNLISKFTFAFVALLSLAAPEAISAPGSALWSGVKDFCSDIRAATKSAIAPKAETDVTPLVPFKGFRNRSRRFRLELLRQQILRDMKSVDRAKIIAAGLADENTPIDLETPRVAFLCSDAWNGPRVLGPYPSFQYFKTGSAWAVRETKEVFLVDPKDREVSITRDFETPLTSKEVRAAALHEAGHCFFGKKHDASFGSLKKEKAEFLRMQEVELERFMRSIREKVNEFLEDQEFEREELLFPIDKKLADISRVQEMECDWFQYCTSLNVALGGMARTKRLIHSDSTLLSLPLGQQTHPTREKRLEFAGKTCDELWPCWREIEANRRALCREMPFIFDQR